MKYLKWISVTYGVCTGMRKEMSEMARHEKGYVLVIALSVYQPIYGIAGQIQ